MCRQVNSHKSWSAQCILMFSSGLPGPYFLYHGYSFDMDWKSKAICFAQMPYKRAFFNSRWSQRKLNTNSPSLSCFVSILLRRWKTHNSQTFILISHPLLSSSMLIPWGYKKKSIKWGINNFSDCYFGL